jgi:hypothetical protein
LVATAVAWVAGSVPLAFTDGWGRRGFVIFSILFTLAGWALCFLPLVAFVDERSATFSIRRFPLIGAGLATLLAAVFILPLAVMPLPALMGLIAGAIYAAALPELKKWTAHTIEAQHIT